MRDDELPFIERCPCGRIARFAIMHPNPDKVKTKYVCSDHVQTLRSDSANVFRIEDGEMVD